jgi:hypothetical protein
MSSVDVPVTRTLARVLRQQLRPQGDPVELLIGIGAGGGSNAYANVILGGQTLSIPKLADTRQPAAGGPAYVLASGDFLLCIGTVTFAALLREDEAEAKPASERGTDA